jgi:fatty-acid desaturase
LAWYEIDHSWILISILKYFGVAKKVRVAKVNTPSLEREAA